MRQQAANANRWAALAQQKGYKMDLEQLIKDLYKVEEYLHKGFVEMAENEIDYIINDAQAAQQGVQWTLLESPRSEVVSCQCGLCKGTHTTLPQSG